MYQEVVQLQKCDRNLPQDESASQVTRPPPATPLVENNITISFSLSLHSQLLAEAREEERSLHRYHHTYIHRLKRDFGIRVGAKRCGYSIVTRLHICDNQSQSPIDNPQKRSLK